MTIPFSAATAAYTNASRLIGQGLQQNVDTTADMTGSGSQGIDFGQLLSQAVQGISNTGKATDQKSLDLLNGKANLVDVSTSVAQTQVAVQGLVAVRDRVISSYQSIMQMPI
ncbi:MAG TPA: flagellar hook-basal body complex protein FliE [Devosiaceae bacterium]|jgi:flagellar hook-basal body complex protein FliE|nr:flagellar hook-basal body complex protein FliE [Devosiaceae bacterium]